MRWFSDPRNRRDATPKDERLTVLRSSGSVATWLATVITRQLFVRTRPTRFRNGGSKHCADYAEKRRILEIVF